MKKLIITALAIVGLVACSSNNAKKGDFMKNFKSTSIDKVNISASKLIGKDWMLITAGGKDSFNTMTASWGMLGHLWNKDVAVMFIRPQRYTRGFADSNDTFTLSFFTEDYRKALQICGTKSGRDTDKVKEAGLTPIATPDGNMTFEEARIVLECRKLYVQDLDPKAFLDTSIIGATYQASDFHAMYIGEILNVYVK
jgi:flavin reductase (DIM6/NTAB) family NADH-FMN oxidoreductase RutF